MILSGHHNPSPILPTQTTTHHRSNRHHSVQNQPIYTTTSSQKTANEPAKTLVNNTSLLKNNNSLCSSISSSSSSSTNSSIYTNSYGTSANATKSTLVKYVNPLNVPTSTTMMSNGAVVKQKSLSPANICLSSRSNSNHQSVVVGQPSNADVITYRHKSAHVHTDRCSNNMSISNGDEAMMMMSSMSNGGGAANTANNKMVYNYNANRLSSYDNDMLNTFCQSTVVMTGIYRFGF